jgi:hypothetical protein
MKPESNITMKSLKFPKVTSFQYKEDKKKIPNQLLRPIYENNWDIITIDKLSKNCARWIVHELMRGHIGESR